MGEKLLKHLVGIPPRTEKENRVIYNFKCLFDWCLSQLVINAIAVITLKCLFCMIARHSRRGVCVLRQAINVKYLKNVKHTATGWIPRVSRAVCGHLTIFSTSN